METALVIAGIQAAVALLQTQMQLAAARTATSSGQEQQALLAAMQAAYAQAARLNDSLAGMLSAHGIAVSKEHA